MRRRTATGLAVVAALAVVAVVALYSLRVERPGALASPTATAAACRNEYIGETPIVPPRKSGPFADVAVDNVRVGQTTLGNTTRWNVRFFDPTDAPGPLGIPLRATVRSASGADLPVVGYEAGPPNAGTERVTRDIEIEPCQPRAAPGTPERGIVVLVIHTGPILSGMYTLAVRDLRLPEGGARDETWQLALTCASAPGGATECR